MKKGSGTRSGLLFEVERLLKECKEYNGNLPDILMLENVPQLHSKKNMPDFQEWINFLNSIGYKSYWQDCNAKITEFHKIEIELLWFLFSVIMSMNSQKKFH